jgi:hypothetical protein
MRDFHGEREIIIPAAICAGILPAMRQLHAFYLCHAAVHNFIVWNVKRWYYSHKVINGPEYDKLEGVRILARYILNWQDIELRCLPDRQGGIGIAVAPSATHDKNRQEVIKKTSRAPSLTGLFCNFIIRV